MRFAYLGFAGRSRVMGAPRGLSRSKPANDTCTLTSTETARRFYLSTGYVQFGPPEPGIGKGIKLPNGEEAFPSRARRQTQEYRGIVIGALITDAYGCSFVWLAG